ncbi:MULTISPECIES: N-acetylglucosamine-6-phosphate deacetylase [Prochlorococcus]|uniref:N-acetylglucosamine-6-phosphate deacetylase n=1 Tax=Prochlorococcus marinus (strain SARG / CCMP1375 / SS120) TaxID=167539 RepID=Q7VE22_PROMA|nr:MULTISPECIES: hypothetical protein [Prochlorococcus]AAP99238.1 N-acetylglucosamine-6-phosphate deacetylase [Prochlorococcus marinus subsp. marinus str. CCMP1375]KGG11493.1 N-acetylglucosamine-6-phosphate deacetylase [Prochlorococcus marinus str. LG]KGG18553.1 N-acetylglucosamine-6-phosphate deacetylase [Prochlorococcus marinus str. SS2]KGG22826.1 N-acetylglucosamine-6-phosphate deacetylase [Prochlorococcus marinus str. SS35]KGG32702.1 N-acetylglucosamine-6-phosphate deacetylase [Prochloroco
MRHLINIRLPSSLPFSLKESLWWIKVDEDGKILSLNPMSDTTPVKGEDWSGDWISPRAVDLQINGGLGLSFVDLDIQQLPKLIELLDFLWAEGVEAISPTLVSCSIKALRNSLDVFRLARQQSSSSRCKLLGAHLEGPFLSKDFKGAHDSKHICLPSLLALEERIRGFEKEITLVTLAPELPGSLEVISKLRELGIIISLGHSAADSETSNLAFKSGVSMITHIFNAMPGLHHRFPGPIGEALSHGEISLGLIADGVHVHPNIASILQKLASDQIFLVSDALAPYGLSKNQFDWDKRVLLIEEGICRLEEGTLAGTTLPLLDGCKRFARWTKQPSAAIWAATVSPRIFLQKRKNIHEFFIGQSLQKLLRWHCNFDSNSLNWNIAE